LACGDPSKTDVVCPRCSKDPFMMEEARKQAAKQGAGDVLEELYKPHYAFLKQGSVDLLWNDLLLHNKDQTPDFTLWRNRKSVELVPPGLKRVLEVGVGMGHAVRYLSQKFPDLEVYGTDISKQSVQHASASFRGHFAVAAPGELPWKGLRFDAILMLEVLEHVEAPRTFEVLRWVHSILAEAGILILSVPLEGVTDLRRAHFVCPHCGQLVHQIGHLRSYSGLEPIQMELARSGFEIERTQGLAGGRYLGISRQWLMPLFPSRISPMVMIFRCRRR
jgi:2-polyprenyl-3-methyl-5-hydroxy-6-metoxy-1,4-benzoquinol methylase